MLVEKGDMVTVGVIYAEARHYRDIVGKTLPVMSVRLPGPGRKNTTVVVKEPDGPT